MIISIGRMVTVNLFIAIDQDFDSVETVYGMGYRWLESG